MRYFVTADPHGFFTLMHNAIIEKGFDENNPDHKLIICGDLMDRGKEARKMQEYILSLIENDKVILIRGNHEDLMLDMIKNMDNGDPFSVAYSHHASNKTLDTALQLTRRKLRDIYDDILSVSRATAATPFVRKIIPKMLNYYETEHYVFVHGWIPYGVDPKYGYYAKELKEATNAEWAESRWENGMSLAIEHGVKLPDKTIVCGHWHTSFGHRITGKIKSEFGNDEDFSPFYADGIIALDSCVSHSKKINCIVIDD